MVKKTGDADYYALLERAAEIQEECRLEMLARASSRPSVPANLSIDLGEYRMTINFEPISGRSQKAVA